MAQRGTRTCEQININVMNSVSIIKSNMDAENKHVGKSRLCSLECGMLGIKDHESYAGAKAWGALSTCVSEFKCFSIDMWGDV